MTTRARIQSRVSGTFSAYVMAVDRVERRLRQVTAALDAAGICYAVVGGNAVAAWVARVDPAATRATKDVDLLARRTDLDAISEVMGSLGFAREDLRGLVMFIDPDEPSRRAGVHLVWAGERVRPSHVATAPSIDDAVRDPEGFRLVSLAALVRMKLTSFLDIDRVHLRDMFDVGLIDATIRAAIPEALRDRLAEVERGE